MMHDTGLMTHEELTQALDAFYTFTRLFGHELLNGRGKIYFNQLRAEYMIRIQTGEIVLTRNSQTVN